MNETQKTKKKFRTSREWKEFRKLMNAKYKGTDAITLHKLRKGANLHHRNLDESQYANLREDWFLPCNNLTHKFIHWLWTYYQKDPAIIERLKAEMEIMKTINKSVDKKKK